MIVLSIVETKIPSINWLDWVIIPILILAVVGFPIYKFRNKLKENKILTLICLILLISFFLPFIFMHLSLYENGKLFYQSDVLGFFGALIGCIITVLGIYWTFNNEKVVSAEGRRNDSLPFLKFELKNTYDIDKPYDLKVIRGIETLKNYQELKKRKKNLEHKLLKLYSDQGIILEKVRKRNTFTGSEEEFETNQKSIKVTKHNIDITSQDLSRIFIYKSTFILNITNIGLQTAILSSISWCSKNDIGSKVMVIYENSNINELTEEDTAKIEMFAVTKEDDVNLKIKFCYCDVLSDIESKIENKEYYDGGDYISIDFTDVYQNKYRYKLPIQLIKVNGNYSVHMDHKYVPVLPELIDKSSS
jgi:hypothetical protein